MDTLIYPAVLAGLVSARDENLLVILGDHGVGSHDHFPEPATSSMIH